MDKFLKTIEDLGNIVDFVNEVVDLVPDAVDGLSKTVDTFKTDSREEVLPIKETIVDFVEDGKLDKEEEVITPAPAILEAEPMKSYFSDNELKCKHCGKLVFDTDFRNKLNAARHSAGNPWTVTSGYRCPQHNAAVGGVADSAHTKGLAVDISAIDCTKKFEVVVNALMAGINRIGVNKSFIHLDADLDKTPNCVFPY